MGGIAFGIVGGIAFGIVGGIAFGIALGSALDIAFAFGIAVGSALGSAFGSALGIVVGIALGIALGIAFGIALGIVFGIALGIAFGIVFGIVVGITGGMVVGIAGGIGVGIAVGIGVILGVILGLYRIPLYLVSGPSALWAYLSSRERPSGVFSFLQRSSLHWDELVFLPLPYLKRTLLIACYEQTDKALAEIAFIAAERPQQLRAARAVALEIAMRDLETRKTLPEIAGAASD